MRKSVFLLVTLGLCTVLHFVFLGCGTNRSPPGNPNGSSAVGAQEAALLPVIETFRETNLNTTREILHFKGTGKLREVGLRFTADPDVIFLIEVDGTVTLEETLADLAARLVDPFTTFEPSLHFDAKTTASGPALRIFFRDAAAFGSSLRIVLTRIASGTGSVASYVLFDAAPGGVRLDSEFTVPRTALGG